MVKPITPREAEKLVGENFPDEVFLAFNELIAEKLHNGEARFTHDEIVERIIAKGISEDAIYKNHWLDVEEAYQQAGWVVVYNKSLRGDTGPSTFTFSVKKKSGY